jgi:nucleoside-triphosphatase THEP1
MKHKLSEKWIKASITGTIWAASEIVLGSFLHNLRVPFSGNILTAIGLIILISISYIWKENGLFWRAGLICAVMKTMSPSAVIFGPMIAIFSESLLLELSVLAIGKNIAGYMTGAVLAMSSNLIHKIVNYIISYGSNIVEVYTNLIRFAQKQLNIETDIVWLPIIILLIVYALFGMFSAVIGMKVGKRMLSQPDAETILIGRDSAEGVIHKSDKTFNYSVIWLIADVLLMVFSFILMNRASWIVWSSSIALIVTIWAIRYNRALRQVKRPKFWIFFVIITLLTTFVFTQVQKGGSSVWQAVLTGIQMNFRAVVVIVGFSVLGTELYNPVIRKFFLGTYFKNFPLALELSVESLPSFIASIPDFKTLIRNPVSVFSKVISKAEMRLSEITEGSAKAQKIFVVTGKIGAGKTTFVKKLAEIFRQENMSTGGFFSERVMEDQVTTGYDLVNAETGERRVFLRQNGVGDFEKIGRFSVDPAGLEMGRAILNSAGLSNARIIIIDEIGSFELDGHGWSDGFERLLADKKKHIIITVRDSNLQKVMDKWKFEGSVVFDAGQTNYHDAGISVLKLIDQEQKV